MRRSGLTWHGPRLGFPWTEKNQSESSIHNAMSGDRMVLQFGWHRDRFGLEISLLDVFTGGRRKEGAGNVRSTIG